MTTTVTGPAFIVPATLAPEMAQALRLLRQRYVADALAWSPELADLEGKCRSVVSVMRDRGFPTGRPNDQPTCEKGSETPGNGRIMTAEEVGAVMGITGRRARQLANDGKLAGSKVGGAWQFRKEDIDAAR